MGERTEFRAETGTSADGATVELGTVEIDGRPFDAFGSVIDERNGMIIGYPGTVSPSSHQHWLKTWVGAPIVPLTITGKAKGFGTTLTCYSAVFNGVRYHGRGLGDGMILRLRAGRRVK